MPTFADAIAPLAEAGFDIAHPFDPGVLAIEGLAAPYGILVGNTRALWPRFLAARRADPALLADPDPLQRYTERTIRRAVGAARCYYSHKQYLGAYLPFQRIAVATGLGTMGTGQLVIHPTYGPWFALRAIVLGDGIPPTQTPSPTACACDASCHRALEAALTARGPDGWRAWLAVRDACTVGRAHRYGEAQLRYHYTRDPSALEE